MTSLLPRPPWSCAIWCDATHIYLEPPCPEGKAPYIATFAKTDGGMSKALAVVAQLSNKDLAPVAPGYFRKGEAPQPTPRPSPRELKPNLQQAAKRVVERMKRA